MTRSFQVETDLAQQQGNVYIPDILDYVAIRQLV